MASIFVFSGVFAAASNFPVVIQWFMKLQPIYHGIQAVRPLFMAPNVAGMFTAAAWLHVLLLALTAVAIYPITYTLFKKRLIT